MKSKGTLAPFAAERERKVSIDFTPRLSQDVRERQQRGTDAVEADFTGTDCQLSTFNGRLS